MPKAIAISGHICSGKSSIINHLSRSYGWDIISFGKYIKHLASTKELPPTRETYQTLGQEVFSGRGACQFLHDAIEFSRPTSSAHLFDGVRHVPMLDALHQVYSATFVIYLDISDFQRYLRFTARASQGDSPLTYDEFLKLSGQPVVA